MENSDAFTVCFAFFLIGEDYAGQSSVIFNSSESDWIKVGLSVGQCFDDCLIFVLIETGGNQSRYKEIGKHVMPLWQYLCTGFNVSEGSVKIFADNETTLLDLHLGSNFLDRAGNISVSINPWENPGKFGPFNIYAGVEFVECGSSRNLLYRWNAGDWKYEEKQPDFIKPRSVYQPEICKGEKLLSPGFSSTWKWASKIADLLGGKIIDYRLRKRIKPWIADISVKGDDLFVWAEQFENLNASAAWVWDDGYPLTNDASAICIFCNSKCENTLCNFKKRFFIWLEKDQNFTLR